MISKSIENWVPALLALEDGRIFDCQSFTGNGEAAGEFVFNTSMTGYQGSAHETGRVEMWRGG